MSAEASQSKQANSPPTETNVKMKKKTKPIVGRLALDSLGDGSASPEAQNDGVPEEGFDFEYLNFQTTRSAHGGRRSCYADFAAQPISSPASTTAESPVLQGTPTSPSSPSISITTSENGSQIATSRSTEPSLICTVLAPPDESPPIDSPGPSPRGDKSTSRGADLKIACPGFGKLGGNHPDELLKALEFRRAKTLRLEKSWDSSGRKEGEMSDDEDNGEERWAQLASE